MEVEPFLGLVVPGEKLITAPLPSFWFKYKQRTQNQSKTSDQSGQPPEELSIEKGTTPSYTE